MNTQEPSKNRRILIVDDNEDIHRDFRKILLSSTASVAALGEMETLLLGKRPAASPPMAFELTSCLQGMDAVEAVGRAVKEGTPYALAFVDVRMPPGCDGIEALQQMWAVDPSMQAVICSAHSDYSWERIISRLGQTDRLFILKKPFDAIEVRQAACALTEKWNQHRAAEEAARSMTLHHTVTRLLLESSELTDAGPKLLAAIGEAHGFERGVIWLCDEETGALWPACTWGAHELGAATPHLPEPSSGGALGRALHDGEPRWSTLGAAGPPSAPSARDPGARADEHDAALADAGIRSALCVPIRSDVPLGAIEMLAARDRASEANLLPAMREIGDKLRMFLEKSRVESALRKSLARQQGLLDALPDTILRIRRDGTCLDYVAARDIDPSRPASTALDHVISGAAIPEFMRHLVRAVDGGGTQVVEYTRDSGDGARELEARIAGIDASEAVVVVRDVTDVNREKREAEQRRAREESLRARTEALLELTTPLIPITPSIVVMPLIGALDVGRLHRIRQALVKGIAAQKNARVAILDMTGVTSLSAEGADEIVRATEALRLLGAHVMLTGLPPSVAQTLVGEGHVLRGIVTHGTLQSGVAAAMRRR